MTTFIVNGKEKELRMDVDGIDISADFIGNTVHGMDTDDEGRYIASQDDYDWWRDVIVAHQEMEEMIAAYKRTNIPDEVDQVAQDWIGCDLDDQPGQVKLALEQVFGKVS